MAGVSAEASHCLKSVEEDFIKVVNGGEGELVELSFAQSGASRFNQSVYYEVIDQGTLQRARDAKQNISFAAGLSKSSLQPVPLGTQTTRKSGDRHVQKKRIISFDLDFKDNSHVEPRDILGMVMTSLRHHNSLPWIFVHSGNGLHLHFKLSNPYKIESAQQYRAIYDACLGYLQCITGLRFDPACSNPSRLMRLPFSINWKDANDPKPCQILSHDSNADFASVWDGFRQMVEFKLNSERKHFADKKKILSKLDLALVLKHFGYDKFESFRDLKHQILCSSPFSSDSNPSFYFEKSRKLYFDFSVNDGGDLFQLIGKFANLDCKKDFTKILALSAKIIGIDLNEAGGFTVNDKGVWYQSAHDADPRWLSSPVYIEAMSRDFQNQSWGRLLTFKDPDNTSKSWSMPMELLAGDGSEIRRNLLNLGVELAIGGKERILFLSYLQSTKPSKRIQCVNRIGWQNENFVLPGRVVGVNSTDSELILQAQSPDKSISTSGSLDQWRDKIGQMCGGNSRLIFAVSTAFASVLLKITGEETGGFHFVGPSSIGKSITLKVAASIWGSSGLGGFLKRWRSTLNGLEQLSTARCDSLLILDELGEINPKDAGNAAYMLTGGVSKNRATKYSSLAPQSEWRLLFLSSGEIGLTTHIAQSGHESHVGQEVRMIDLPADTGKHGIFEDLHGIGDSGSFATALAANAEQYFGSPIVEFLEKLVVDPNIHSQINEIRQTFEREIKAADHGQIHRVAKRFSLVAAAGELAIRFGILPMEQNEALKVTLSLFMDWKKTWTRVGSRESQRLLDQIKSLLQEYGASRFPVFTEYKKNPENHTQSLWGFRKVEGDECQWIILSEVFRNHFCKGHDYRRALKELKGLGLLKSGPSPMRVPHLKVTRVLVLSGKILADV